MTATHEALAAFARRVVADHTEWDSFHHFATLYLAGGGVRVGTWAAFDPGVHPDRYPAHMIGIVSEEVAKTLAGGGTELPVAVALQIEAFTVAEPEPGADPLRRQLLDADLDARVLYTRPDAVEVCSAWCVAVDGHVWMATKQRDTPGDVEEKHYPPGHKQAPGGTMIQALHACAKGICAIGAAVGVQ